ncbi:MAG: hypothetical protein Q7U97_02385 [Rhodocyclaceae bacterium]|nr:hypothetical protein [Rhodocyclaceae bacterium]
MDISTIGLENEQRSDFDLRKIFVDVYGLVVPFMTADGNWISQADELQAQDALERRFPEVDGVRRFAVIATIAAVRSSGRTPAN